MTDSILAKIKALPPLDDTVVKIQAICMDKNSSLSNLSEVIEQDPMLTANILKAANSPLYGFSREVKNINHAVSLFGMATVRGFALSSAIRQNIKIDLSPYGITNAQFLEISTLQSALMMQWYSKVNREMLDILTPASFLMEIGKIILAHEIIEKKEENNFLENVKKCANPAELSRLEHETVELNNEEVTATIFEQWNLEIELVEAIKYSSNPLAASEHIRPYAQALQIVKTSINVIEQLTNNAVEASILLVNENGLNSEAYQQAVEQVKQ